MFGLGAMEIGLVLVMVIMVFGLGKLPQVAQQLGAGIKSFQKSLREEDDEEPKKLGEDDAETPKSKPAKEDVF